MFVTEKKTAFRASLRWYAPFATRGKKVSTHTSATCGTDSLQRAIFYPKQDRSSFRSEMRIFMPFAVCSTRFLAALTLLRKSPSPRRAAKHKTTCRACPTTLSGTLRTKNERSTVLSGKIRERIRLASQNIIGFLYQRLSAASFEVPMKAQTQVFRKALASTDRTT